MARVKDIETAQSFLLCRNLEIFKTRLQSLNNILISNQIANFSEIFTALNDAGIALSRPTKLPGLHFVGYEIIIPNLLYTFIQKLIRSLEDIDDQNWSVDSYNKVILSDESRLCIPFGYHCPRI